MRAQANYIESAPFVLVLIAALEISGASRTGLAAIAPDMIYLSIFAVATLGIAIPLFKRTL